MPHPRPAYDPLPKHYLGAIYGHPVVQGQPPPGAPPADRGGVWDLKQGVYRPPRGGQWSYHPAGPTGFDGTWTYSP